MKELALLGNASERLLAGLFTEESTRRDLLLPHLEATGGYTLGLVPLALVSQQYIWGGSSTAGLALLEHASEPSMAGLSMKVLAPLAHV
jgi:hypothetical protein